MNSDNRRRAFADVVTVEAWHDDFKNKRSTADLYADVVFGTARLGGESESPVRFRLNIRRAELIIVIPELEPVSVDPKTVSRDAPTAEGRLVEVVEESKGTSASIGLAASADTSSSPGGRAAVTAAASKTIQQKQSKKLELRRNVAMMMVTQSKSGEGHYRWIIEASGDFLEGRPWNAEKQPRLKLIDRRKDPSKGIPPTVRVEVRCRREDLIITDLQIKDEKIWESLKTRIGYKNREAAAISYIRSKLTEENLEVENLEDIFGQLTLGSTTAQSG